MLSKQKRVITARIPGSRYTKQIMLPASRVPARKAQLRRAGYKVAKVQKVLKV